VIPMVVIVSLYVAATIKGELMGVGQEYKYSTCTPGLIICEP
jgi:hypothetical protein